MTDIACSQCPPNHKLPAFRVIGGSIVIQQRHHGDHHVTVIALTEVLAQVQKDEMAALLDTLKVLA